METPSLGFFLGPCGGMQLSKALVDEYSRWRSECEVCGQIYEGGRELAVSKMRDHVVVKHGSQGWAEAAKRYEDAVGRHRPDPSEARVELTEAGRAYLKERGL